MPYIPPENRKPVNWVQRTGDAGPLPEGFNESLVGFLRIIVEAESKALPRNPAPPAEFPEGGKLFVSRTDITVATSVHPDVFEKFADTMTKIKGAAIRDEQVKDHEGQMENRCMTFPGGVTLTYMLSKGHGVTINVPRNEIAGLTTTMHSLGLMGPGATMKR